MKKFVIYILMALVGSTVAIAKDKQEVVQLKNGRKLRVQYLLNNFAIFDGVAGCFSVAFWGLGYPSFFWRFKKNFSS